MKFSKPIKKQIILLALLSILVACRSTPVTDREQLILVPESQEIQMGLTAYQQILSESKLSDDPEKVAMVRRIGERIAAAADKPDYQWEFNLIEDDSQVNAFALPGGKVAVYTGILPITQNEAGLATVMAHEVAHATARHGGERMSTGLLAQFGMMALDVGLAMKNQDPQMKQALLAAYGAAAQVGVILPFSRKQESEADRIGLTYMAKAGYDPKEALQFWERMSKVEKQKAPEFLSTHPSDETRVEQIAKWIPEVEEEYREGQRGMGAG
ncbi:MAG: M48 family metallopeptidase [Candidatus Manganitrophus sp.]|nr:M48 family metallopeptidase [Candidatus Manganitrophus sp.]WDT70590.1 MAG: M48 family metallopeptidase [Candidatus Manganitrophus sp.]